MIRLKNKEQIDGIRKSCALLSEFLERLRPMVQPGVSLLELDKFAYDYTIKRGGKPAFLDYEGYPASICLSVNETVIHGIPSKRRLVEGDIIGADYGIELDGYFSDSAVTWAVGKVGSEADQLMRVTRECLDKAIEAVVPGARVHDIARAVFSHATRYGYGVVRQYCGHGVGLEMHEDPQIPNYISSGPNPRLLPGMVIAIEPMINAGKGDVKELADDWTVVTLDGSLSAHYEHTVLVTESGHEVLTSWTF
ncbi:MAG TPA: type I methionyl aminopeptidase [Rectinemataceae bacterium]|nr:type I methionyl aminopeptidase [Rectinemataceae bacterium]